jgi:hypothetical protein
VEPETTEHMPPENNPATYAISPIGLTICASSFYCTALPLKWRYWMLFITSQEKSSV